MYSTAQTPRGQPGEWNGDGQWHETTRVKCRWFSVPPLTYSLLMSFLLVQRVLSTPLKTGVEILSHAFSQLQLEVQISRIHIGILFYAHRETEMSNSWKALDCAVISIEPPPPQKKEWPGFQCWVLKGASRTLSSWVPKALGQNKQASKNLINGSRHLYTFLL